MIIIIIFNIQKLQMRCKKTHHTHLSGSTPIFLLLLLLFCLFCLFVWTTTPRSEKCYNAVLQSGMEKTVMAASAQGLLVGEILLLHFTPRINEVCACSQLVHMEFSCFQDKASGCGRTCFLKDWSERGSEAKYIFLCSRDWTLEEVRSNELVSGVSGVEGNTIIKHSDQLMSATFLLITLALKGKYWSHHNRKKHWEEFQHWKKELTNIFKG